MKIFRIKLREGVDYGSMEEQYIKSWGRVGVYEFPLLSAEKIKPIAVSIVRHGLLPK
jgi:hypothetical protein